VHRCLLLGRSYSKSWLSCGKNSLYRASEREREGPIAQQWEDEGGRVLRGVSSGGTNLFAIVDVIAVREDSIRHLDQALPTVSPWLPRPANPD
jgi:hypothetical protein